MGGWIALGILILLGMLPLGVALRYDADGALVRIIAGPVKITLFPKPKKEKKAKKEKKEKPAKKEKKPAKKASKKKKSPSGQKTKPAAQQQTAEKKGGSVTDFLPLVKTVFNFLGDFRRKLRVNLLELKITLGGDDPCDLAVNYGRAWTAVGNLMPRLERFLKIKKRDVDVQCDFTASSTTVFARLELTITLGRLLGAVLVFAFHALVEFLKIMKKRKGGSEHEPKSS